MGGMKRRKKVEVIAKRIVVGEERARKMLSGSDQQCLLRVAWRERRTMGGEKCRLEKEHE
jgi:hypothetical protein